MNIRRRHSNSIFVHFIVFHWALFSGKLNQYITWAYPGSSTHGVRIQGTIFAKSAGGPGGRYRAPGGVQGQNPGGGAGGEPPWKYAILGNFRLILMHSGASK